MTDLVACLSTGKGTWETVVALIGSSKFEKVFLLTNEFGHEHFKAPENVELIKIDTAKSSKEISDFVQGSLKGRIRDTEVAVNMTSGSGKEHLGMISAILKLGLGIRFVDMKVLFQEANYESFVRL